MDEKVRRHSTPQTTTNEVRDPLRFFSVGPVVAVCWKNAPNWPAEHVSQNIIDLAGVSAEALISGQILYINLIHPDDRQRVIQEVEQYLAEGADFYQQEYRLVHPDGAQKWVHDVTHVIRAGGAVTAFQGYLLDITDQKKTESLLAESRAQYADLVESQHAGIYRIRVSQRGDWNSTSSPAYCYEFVSPQYCAMFGVSREELLSNPGVTLAQVHPEDLPGFVKANEEANRTLEPFVWEGRMVIKGHTRWIRFESRSRKLESGDTLWTGVALDIDNQRKAEETLRESEERYRTLAEAAHDMIFIINREDRVEYANRYAAQSIGRRPEDLVGLQRATLFPSAVADHQRQSLQKVFESGKPYYAENTIPTPNRNIQLGTWLAPIHNKDGTVKTVLGVSRDITEQKLMEERLRQAQKMEAVGQLAGGVAHDFNNQLVGIMGFADLLSQRLKDEQLQAYAKQIVSAAKRSSDLTRQLLAFARKGKYLATAVDLHAIVADVVSLLERSIDKRITIKQYLNAPHHTVMGDPTQLHNAILNLGVNARDAMPNGGELAFRTAVIEVGASFGQTLPLETEPGTYLEITVSDTGIGMSEEILSRIFEPFFTTKEPGKGTGMGLSAVYGTMRSHHGAVTVQSTPGQGSVFRVILPMAKPADVEGNSAAQDGIQTKSAHILMVDDEAVVRTLVSELLGSLGHRTTICRDGHEALEFYRQSWHAVDLVILDMVMPRMNGRDLFLAMRRVNPKVRALLASGFSINGEAQAVLSEGVLGFIQKPFTADELSRVVSRALK